MHRVSVADILVQDLRFAIRQLWKNSGFASTAILMLALGMCASVAIFAFVDAALIKPLPYHNPSRLIGVFGEIPLCPRCNVSYPDYLDLRKLNKVLSSSDVYDHSDLILRTPTGAQPVGGARVSDGFFRTLGVSPVLGRNFYSGEDLPAASRSVILSYTAWQKWYGGKLDILGGTVTLDGTPYTAVGVLPRDFHFAPAEPAEFWTAIHATDSCDLNRRCHSLYGVARLKDGISLQTALADLKSIAKGLETQYPDSNRDQSVSVATLTEVIVGDIGPILRMLLGGAVLLLLIACVNIASLLIVRSETRRREIAVRNALGVSAARLISQFVTEGLVLVAVGTLLGLLCAYGAIRLLLTLIPAGMFARMSYLHGLGFTTHSIALALAIALLAAILFSLTPMLRLSFSDMQEGLAAGSRGSAGTAWRRLGSKLVVLELAIALVLLVGAGLLGKSFYRLLHVDIGFRPDHLATLEVTAPESSYGTNAQLIALERQIVDRIQSLPGVRSVGIARLLPVGSNGSTRWIRVLGRPYNGEHNEVPERQVSSAYFTTLGAKLIRGRYFSDTDDDSKPRVLIINQAMARQYFAGEDPIGKQLSFLTNPPVPMEIVGIIEDIKEGPLDSAVPPAVYLSFNQNERNYFSIVVRTSQTERSLLPTLAAIIRAVDRDIAISAGATMTDVINDSQSAYLHRSSAYLVGGFAVLALLLSVVGVYGVIAYSVSQRTREIGVRMSLGADRSSVCYLILKEAGGVAAAGIVIGLLCSVTAANLIRGLLFGVQSWDLPTLAAVTALLVASALLASYIPARRAASVNPVEALRAE